MILLTLLSTFVPSLIKLNQVMNKFVLLLLLLVAPFALFSQSKEQKEELKNIEGAWNLDNNGNIVYSRVIEDIEGSKEDIYNKVLNFFAYNYNSSLDVIQVKDKEVGIVTGKGYFKDFSYSTIMLMISMNFSAYHVLRVDIKDGRARAILSVDRYELVSSGGDGPDNRSSIPIKDCFPVNKNGNKGQKKIYTKAFIDLNNRCLSTLDLLEKSLKEGNTSPEIEKSDW